MTTNIAGTFIYIYVCRMVHCEWVHAVERRKNDKINIQKKKRSKQQPNCGDASTRTSDPRAILKLVDDEDDEYKIMAIEGRLFCKSQPCCAHSHRHTEAVNTQVVGTRHTTFSHSTLMFLYFFWFFCFFFCCFLVAVDAFFMYWKRCGRLILFGSSAVLHPFSLR